MKPKIDFYQELMGPNPFNFSDDRHLFVMWELMKYFAREQEFLLDKFPLILGKMHTLDEKINSFCNPKK